MPFLTSCYICNHSNIIIDETYSFGLYFFDAGIIRYSGFFTRLKKQENGENT